MATKKTVQLDLQITGAKTLADMENVLAGINDELKDVEINSDAFNELNAAAKAADAQLAKVNESLERVTSQEKADAALKLSEGIVGGMQAAAAASALFGDEIGGAIDRGLQTAAELQLAMDGVKKVTEAFSASTIKGLKGIVLGFKQSAIGAKLFGTTTKAAIAATGIGLLVIAIGLIVANWDKVVDAVIAFKDQLKNIPVIGSLIIAVEKLVDSFGSLESVMAGIVGFFKALFSFDFDNLGNAFRDAADEAQRLLDIEEDLERARRGSAFSLAQTNNLLDEQRDAIGKLEASHKLVLGTLTAMLNAEIDISKQKDIQKAIDIQNLNFLKQKKRELEILAGFAAFSTAASIEGLKEEAKLNAELLDINLDQALQNRINGASEDDRKKLADDFIELEADRLRIIKDISTLRNIALDAQQEFIEISFEIKGIEAATAEEIKKANELRREALNLAKLQESATGRIGEISNLITDELVEEKRTRTSILAQMNATVAANKENARNTIINNIEGINLLNTIKLVNEEMRNGGENLDILWESMTGKLAELAQDIQWAADQLDQFFTASLDFQATRIEGFRRELAILVDQEAEAAQRVDELKELLADADGERRAEILRQIEEEEAAETKLGKAKIEVNNKLNAALIKQAKWEKAQAIVTALTQGAIAAITAIAQFGPIAGPILAAAVVAPLTAFTVAGIASRPLPQFENAGFAEGGHTGDGGKHEVAGVVHRGEYVVPSNVLSTSDGSALVSLLEGMRGFAEGGFTTPSQAPVVATRTAGDIGVTAGLSGANIFVSVKEIESVGKRVQVIESRATI